MYQREWIILKTLEKGGYVTSNQLADRLGLSVKTVQKSMTVLNDFLGVEVAYIQSKTGKGYSLNVVNQEAYQKCLAQFKEQRLDTPEQRQSYLLNSLLKFPYIKAEETAAALYTSKKTLSNSLRSLRESLQVYGLDVKTRPYYGLYLDGREEDIRLMMSLTEDIDLYELSSPERKDFEELLKSYGIDSHFYRTNLIRTLQVVITRSKSGKCLTAPSGNKSSPELQMLSQVYGWDLSRVELASLQDSLSSFRASGLTQGNIDNLKLCLTVVEETFGIEFSKDSDFMDNLWQHVQKLQERIKNRVILKNPLLSEIKQNLKNEFVMASLLAGGLSQAWKLPLLEDEIGFLSLIFATTTSKINSLKKHMLVVCFETGSGKDFLQTTYQSLFGRYIHQVTVSNPEEIRDKDLSQYDCIVSTVPLPEFESYNLQYVPYFLEEQDKQAIKRRLTSSENFFVEKLLEKVIYLDKVDSISKEQVIEDICKEIEDLKSIDLRDKVLSRLSMGVTQLGQKVALLHPKGKLSEHFISVTVLPQPLYWESSEISVVCLVSLPTIDGINKLIYQILSTFMIEEFYLDCLLQSPSAATLQAILQKIKERELKDHVY